MAHEKLKALIEQARTESKVLYCPGNNQFYTPADMDNLNAQGKCLWAVEHFELRSIEDCRTELYTLPDEKPKKKGILYFPVAECGTVRIFSDDISFWYYEKKSMQTMLHLKSGDCLRVEQDIETVDLKISESKVPAIGKEVAEFWYELLKDYHAGKEIR